MISKKAVFICALAVGSASHADIDKSDLVAGIATGLLARGICYALKQQGYTSQQSVSSSVIAIALATVTVQLNKQCGCVLGAGTQLGAAFVTFLATACISPTPDNQVTTTTTATELSTGSNYSGTAIWGPETFIEAIRED